MLSLMSLKWALARALKFVSARTIFNVLPYAVLIQSVTRHCSSERKGRRPVTGPGKSSRERSTISRLQVLGVLPLHRGGLALCKIRQPYLDLVQIVNSAKETHRTKPEVRPALPAIAERL